MNILLDYFFKITSVSPTPQASTAFLKQACIVCLPKSGQEGNVGTIYTCTSMTQVAARTDNVDAQQLFNAGMSKVYVLLADDLDLESFLEGHESDFYTLIISSDFDKDDVEADQADATVTITDYAALVSGTDDAITIDGVAFTAQAGAAVLGETTFQAATSNDATAASLAAQINGHTATAAKVTAAAVGAVVTITAKNAGSAGNAITLTYTDNDTNVGATLAGASGGHLNGGDGLFGGAFEGVICMAENDLTFLAEFAATENRVGFYKSGSNGAKNLCYAMGKVLANAVDWANQQYITMPFADDVDDLGECELLFEDKISFVLDDSEFGKRLGLLAAGGKAIVAPYIKKNLMIDMQSKALSYVSGNQPQYTLTHAALLQDELQKIIDGTEETPGYVDKGWLTGGSVRIALEQENFVASGYIDIPTPTALWRIVGEITETN